MLKSTGLVIVSVSISWGRVQLPHLIPTGVGLLAYLVKANDSHPLPVAASV